MHFFDVNPQSLSEFCQSHGMQGFVATQVLDWVYRKGVVDPQAMTNISARNRDVLCEHMMFYTGTIVRQQIATDGTQKLLMSWKRRNVQTSKRPNEGTHVPLDVSTFGRFDVSNQTECVMIPTDERRTACISSQVGCPVGCKFCASGIGGLDGNLTAGQIVEQVHRLSFEKSEGRDQRSDEGNQDFLTSDLRPLTSAPTARITNIVFMGMGEPLANFANVTNAIRTLNAEWGMHISARKITVSTVGLPAAIRKLVEFEIPVTLALSLHAPNDEIRKQLIPWAEYATIEELLDVCDEYFQKTGREITLEYLLLRNVNDGVEHAKELATLAKRLRANVNLIRYNEVKGVPFDRPTTHNVLAFQNVLRERHVNAHLRASRGRDIAAACGQLRHEHKQVT